MENVKELLAILEYKYSQLVSLEKILESKYLFETKKDYPEGFVLDESENDYIVLSDDVEKNQEFLKNLVDGVDNLKRQLNIGEKEIANKIIEDYITQLEKISCKKLETGEKLAHSVCKCLKKTILKLSGIKDFGGIIIEYLKENGFEVKSFESGHKLTDDDLCYLDENLIQVYKKKTTSEENNYKVIVMIQPIIKLSYIDADDDKVYSHCVPGICEYFAKEV